MTDTESIDITVAVNVDDSGRLQANVAASNPEPKIHVIVNEPRPDATELQKRMHAIIEGERRRPPGAGAAAYRNRS